MKIPGPKGATPNTLTTGFPPGAIVSYENDGNMLLGVILGFKKDKYLLLNERERQLELQASRLHALQSALPVECETTNAKAAYLAEFHGSAREAAGKIEMEELWQVVHEQPKEYSNKELCELYYGKFTPAQHLALRIALLGDPTYFKRNKDTFSPRTGETVEELRKAEKARQEKLRVRSETLSWVEARLSDPKAPAPRSVLHNLELLENVAAGAEHLDNSSHRDAKELIDSCAEELHLDLSGSKEARAIQLLERIAHFDPDQNLWLIKYRQPIEFPEAVLNRADTLRKECLGSHDSRPRLDLTALDCFTVDDTSTLDMDDALSLERMPGGYRLGVHISDVASFILPGDPVELEAARRCTSLYLPDQTINMLPEALAHDALSLVAGDLRRCLSCFFTVNEKYEITGHEIASTIIKVKKRYDYDQMDSLLESDTGELNLIYNISLTNETLRLSRGAQKVSKRDLTIIVKPGGEVELKEIDEHGPARGMIGEMMVLANSYLADYGSKHRLPLVYRSQEPPEEQAAQDIPAGPAYDYSQRARLKKSITSTSPAPHAGLGLEAYIQATSPIRRYIDLCNQRQIMHHLATNKVFYPEEQLQEIIHLCDEPLSKAQYINKQTRRYWLLKYLKLRAQRGNKKIIGTIIRTDLKNPLVELEEVFMPVIARIDGNYQRGDRVELTISAIDPKTDYIRLEGRKV
ncbi:MAG: hypothetical protein DCC75_03595 [Proteobacteria bacterium]|nr:MAG: hypothetical protein DCC75_03595 [Pseudomonadota bacterium]